MALTEVYTAEQQDDKYMGRLPEIKERLLAGYHPELGFHGPDHGENVEADSLKIREGLIANDVPDVPGVFVTSVAADGHDHGIFDFFRGGLSARYKFPEQLAMARTSEALRKAGVDWHTVHQIISYQLPTRAGVRAKTVGAFTLCTADVCNIEKDYATVFEPNKEALRQEEDLLKGALRSKADYDDFAMWLLSKIHTENLDPANLPVYTSALFSDHAQRRSATLTHLAELRAHESGLTVVEYVGKIGECAVQAINPDMLRLPKDRAVS